MTDPSGRQPPRWAAAALAAALPEEDREAVLLEMAELFEIRLARDGEAGARRWYRRQVAAFVWELTRHGRGRSSGRRTAATYAMGKGWREVDMSRWMADLTQATRRLVRAPVFSVVSILTIGIGIGAFTSILSLVDSVLLEPMPYEEPDELVWVWRDYVEADFPRGWLGGPDVVGMVDQPDVFEDVVAFRSGAVNLAGVDGTAPSQVLVHYTTAGLFDLLGVPLHLGREPRPDEVFPDGPELAVISHDLWRTQFGADPAIVGGTIMLSQVPTEVIGVAPEGFRFVKHGSLVDPQPADIYMPLGTDLAMESPGSGAYAALARLRAGTPPARLEAALVTAGEAVNDYMAQYDASPVRLWSIGLAEDLVAPVRPALLALIASAGFLLLVLVANLATLLLGRAAGREREVGIRIALGAGRGRVVADVLAESFVLAAVGGTVGLGLAVVGTDLVVRLAPEGMPRLAEVGLDLSVLAAAIALAGGMALAAGLAPSLHSMRTSVAATLKEGGARSGGGVRGARARSALVATQVALSLMLLVGAGLTADAFAGLLRADPGFDAGGTLTFRIPLPGAIYQGEERMRFHDDVRTGIAALPGVSSVGGTTSLPLTAAANQRGIAFPGAPGNTGDEQADEPLIDMFRVTPDYFEASGHRVVQGRGIEALDADTTTFNVVIDDVLARRFFPDGSAVGSSVAVFEDTATIVGVVDQARLYTVHADDRGQLYVPVHLIPTTSMSYAVRSGVDPESLVPAIRDVVRALDPAVPVSSIRTLDQIVGDSLGQQRLSLTLILAFALSALVLAALGLYGVVANSVVRRTREIGVRIAMGADPDSVVRMVVRRGVGLALVGAAIGLVGAVSTSQIMEGVMFGVDTGSPGVYAAVAVGLIVVATVSSYLPARRATRIDPQEALRPE